MPDIQGTLQREVMQAMVDAAKANKLSLHADAIAVSSQAELLVVTAPVSGVEDIDFKAMLDGRASLDGLPVMFWYLAGETLRDKAAPLDEGYYTVVADQQEGVLNLRDTKGETVAQGDLEIVVEPQGRTPAAVAKTRISGKITSAEAGLFPPRFKVCGEVSVKKNGVTVKVSGCVAVGF